MLAREEISLFFFFLFAIAMVRAGMHISVGEWKAVMTDMYRALGSVPSMADSSCVSMGKIH